MVLIKQILIIFFKKRNGVKRARTAYCGAWSWRLKFFMIFSLTILVEKSRGHRTHRPGLLRAEFLEERGSRLGRNLASRTRRVIPSLATKKEFGTGNWATKIRF